MSSKSSKWRVNFSSTVGIAQMCQMRAYPSVARGLERERESVWTRRSLASISTLEQQGVDPPSGHVIYNILTKVTGKHMVNDSNRSVHLFQKVLTVTWILTVGLDEQMAACFLLTDFNLVTSYMSKLEGIFRALKIIKHSKIKICILNFLHWCDNEQRVIDSQYA